MMPTVEKISTKNVLTIDINSTLEDAVKKMASSNLRNIIVTENIDNLQKYYLLTIDILIDFKLNNFNSNTILKELNLPKAKILKKDLNILNVLNEVNVNDKYMVIVDENKLIGILSYTDIINNIDPQILMKKQTIATLILQYKAITTYKDTSTIQTVQLMKNHDTDAVIIINDREEPIGIFTTKDLIMLINLNCDLNEPIKEFMTTPVLSLLDNSTISDAIDFIREKHFKRIVIINEINQVSGILTQKELLRIVYNKWIDFIKEEGNRISKINEKLLTTTSKLEEKASFDFLTKLYNRQKFDSFLDYEIKKSNRYETQSLSILLIDIDFFKNVNDNYGHLVGDQVLQEIAKILTVCSRDTDIVSRWGGEEFIVMLPSTNIEQAIFVAEKLRATIEKHKFEQVNHVTCSIGVSQHYKNQPKEEFFNKVDQALYSAKNNGRNRVEIEYI